MREELMIHDALVMLQSLGVSPILAMIKPLGKNSRNSFVAKGSLTIERQLG